MHEISIECPDCVDTHRLDLSGFGAMAVHANPCARCFGTALIKVTFDGPDHVPSEDKIADPIKCRQCSKEFTAQRSSIRYCDDCRDSPAMHKKRCKLCLSPFRTRNKSSELCSKGCRTGWHQLPKHEATCAFCNTPFMARMSWQRYCSYDCKKKYRKELYHIRRWQKLDDEIHEIGACLANGTAHEGYGTEARARTRLWSLLAKRENRD